jgi:hypothetical protein
VVVDAVDDPVGVAVGAVSVVQRRPEPLAHAVKVGRQRADDEPVGGRGDGPG